MVTFFSLPADKAPNIGPVEFHLASHSVGDLSRPRSAQITLVIGPAGSQHPPLQQRHPGGLLPLGDSRYGYFRAH